MDFANLTFLVVEDHDFQRRALIRLLRDLGAEHVLEAANGREALDALAARGAPVDAVLCDLDMPEMDGIEFISHLAEQRLAQAIAVVSGMEPSILNTVETMARAYGLQVLGAIAKPLTREALLACLGRFEPRSLASHGIEDELDFTVEDLKAGLANREFLAFFQPKVSFRTGEVLSVEALVRWFRAGHGVVSPIRFIPRMELEGLVLALTESILEQTCAYLRAWEERGLRLDAAVNVSMLCFSDVGIADRFQRIVQEGGCEPQRITFEVTETAIMGEVAKVLNVLARLRMKGFGLSIDDFGTGYSSLQQLSNVPFTELKIDQSFTKDAPSLPRNRTIVETSLELARKLGLKTVAEGVETRAEWDLLRSLGCDLAQGYFVARPMPGHQILDWAQLWRPPETD